jgi:hypothetical protein
MSRGHHCGIRADTKQAMHSRASGFLWHVPLQLPVGHQKDAPTSLAGRSSLNPDRRFGLPIPLSLA